MSYDLTWKGKLTEKLYATAEDPRNATVRLLTKDMVVQTRFHIQMEGGGSFPVFSAHVPDNYVGKEVELREILTKKKGVFTLKQRLSAEGLPTLLASLKWKAAR